MTMIMMMMVGAEVSVVLSDMVTKECEAIAERSGAVHTLCGSILRDTAKV